MRSCSNLLIVVLARASIWYLQFTTHISIEMSSHYSCQNNSLRFTVSSHYLDNYIHCKTEPRFPPLKRREETKACSQVQSAIPTYQQILLCATAPHCVLPAAAPSRCCTLPPPPRHPPIAFSSLLANPAARVPSSKPLTGATSGCWSAGAGSSYSECSPLTIDYSSAGW